MEDAKRSRRYQAMKTALRNFGFLKSLIRKNIHELIEYDASLSPSIQRVSVEEFLSSEDLVKLQNFSLREGNVSYLELLVIGSVVAKYKPKNLLEIGTFDGCTTLQLALNSCEDATVHTLDLEKIAPDDPGMLIEDLKYIFDEKKKRKKYERLACREKIIEHIGDSREVDFSRFCKKQKVDFCFIDGGHSYECVKNDTEKLFDVLSEDACVLWHDYSPNCSGVFQYLNELSKTKRLLHIEGTSLVFFKAGD